MTLRPAGLCAAALVASLRVSAQAPVEPLPTPAGADSGMYALTTGADGRTYLSWIEPVAAGGHAFRFSRLDGGQWSAPVDVARGADWFVNWADHPSMTATADGRLYAHWLVNTGRRAGAYGYGIRVATSSDAGTTWRTVFDEGMANVKDYAGFLSFLPGPRGVDAVFLTPVTPDDGSGGEEERTKTLGAVRFTGESASTPTRADGDVCSCCSTDVAMTGDGPVAVYRDHADGEIRDIAIVRRIGDAWTPPAPVHRDGWRIGGCPTNGPAVAARGRQVAVAWFTAADDRPALNVAFSSDAGATFAAPVRVDGGQPVGWADVLLLEDGRALVSWLERAGDGQGEIRIRPVAGQPAPAVTVARASSGRSTGIPQMARAGGAVIVAWRDGRVKTARVAIPGPATPARERR